MELGETQELRGMPVMEERIPMEEAGENYHQEILEKIMTQSKKSLLKKWDVRIEHLDSGCIVRIGCKSLAFSSATEAMTEVNDWQKDPHTALKNWYQDLI